MKDDLLNFIGNENIQKISELSMLMQKKVFELYELCYEKNLYFCIASGLRAYEEQKELFDNYAGLYGIEQTGVPGNSEHERGIAIDITIGENLSYNEHYKTVGMLWKGLGGLWGGDTINEYWHFELPE